MKYTIEQIGNIIKSNPNKDRIAKGQEMAKKLMLHLHGSGMDSAISHVDYFVNKELYEVQKKNAISNKDMFGRLLQQEDMVFTARGGSSSYGLSESEEKKMNAIVDDVRFGMSLRKWVRNFALQAYRSDPMGIIFIEVEQASSVTDGVEITTPRAYPTYKSSFSIYDYASTGRRLDYVAFKLKVGEARAFGIQDASLRDRKADEDSEFFRFVDDGQDIIVKREGETVHTNFAINGENPIPNKWERTPAFIVSDLMLFNDPSQFVSPLDLTVELADCFLNDRSVRELQKKYHGFAKAIEPLMACSKCDGTGMIAGNACPDCTAPGGEKGTGYKLKTKQSDVFKFPLDILKDAGSFDFKRIFGYVTPDIESWNKQDMSLEALEELIFFTYWGSHRAVSKSNSNNSEGNKQGGGQETATAKFIDTQPVYSRLGMTADWAEKTEKMIADFIGGYWFEGSFKSASIAYGRNYILETPDELMKKYQEMRSKGAPDFSLDEALEKYYHAMYQNNPVQLAKYIKLLRVEPFPHVAMAQAKGVITEFADYCAKLYFGEWYSTLTDAQIVSPAMTPQKMRELLKVYVEGKKLTEPEPENPKPITK